MLQTGFCPDSEGNAGFIKKNDRSYPDEIRYRVSVKTACNSSRKKVLHSEKNAD